MTTPSVVPLLAAIHQHMTTFDLPEPCTVTVDPHPVRHGRQVAVHTSADGSMPVLAGKLLAWADSLTDIAVSAWRSHDGQSLHVEIGGVLTDGHTTVEAWGGVAYDAARFELAPGERRPVTFGCLREWAAQTAEMPA
jgi:hypothetical protein